MAEPIELRTRTTSYWLAATESGSGLQAAGWGPSGTAALAASEPRLPGFDTPEDLIPHEYGVAGTRQVAESELLVRHSGGRSGVALRLAGEPELTRTETGDTLLARLCDAARTLQVDLRWRTSSEHDVVLRSASITNTGDGPVELGRALSGAFNIHLPGGAMIDALAGGWCEEFSPVRTTLGRGSYRIGSRQGLVSHLWSPVVTLSDPTDADRGRWSVMLAWSGSWQLDVHATNRLGWVRVAAGVDEESPITLEPGQRFDTPEIAGLWAPDADAAANAWQHWQRTELLRDTRAAHRPIGYNSWYTTEFDVGCDQQIELAERAARLGCEMLVLDDGWFTGRDSDRAGLGDWTPDPRAFPDGLAPLVDAVHGLGMKFGLWIEPEGVNPDSELFRAHPDWIHRSPDREPVTIRNQYVLDLGRPEVEEWVASVLRRLLTENAIDHLKWDMNRAITDGGSALAAPGTTWSIAHTRAYHRLLGMLRTEFPKLTLEACSGGGGRIDASVLANCDVVWPSDETGPRDRLAIQHGFLSAWPAAAMSSWVTHLDGFNDDRPASLDYRCCVAMCGVLGLGADLRTWDTADEAKVAGWVRHYKRVREVVHNGAVYRHGLPREHGYAVEYVAVDPRVVVFVFGAPDTDAPIRLQLAGADWRSHPSVQTTAGSARWDGEDLLVELDPQAGAALLELNPGLALLSY